MPTSSRRPYPHIEPPRATPYSPLQLHFLSRLAHLVNLCYDARHEPAAGPYAELVQQALRSTIDDCFDAGLAPEIYALLEGELEEA